MGRQVRGDGVRDARGDGGGPGAEAAVVLVGPVARAIGGVRVRQACHGMIVRERGQSRRRASRLAGVGRTRGAGGRGTADQWVLPTAGNRLVRISCATILYFAVYKSV